MSVEKYPLFPRTCFANMFPLVIHTVEEGQVGPGKAVRLGIEITGSRPFSDPEIPGFKNGNRENAEILKSAFKPINSARQLHACGSTRHPWSILVLTYVDTCLIIDS
jgi:hypothetical protein